MIRPPIPPSFTTDYGPGHVDTDDGVYTCDAAADLLADDGDGPGTIAVLHIHLTNPERPTHLRSVGVELTADDVRGLIARLSSILLHREEDDR